jgi:hypothetical protein
MRKKGKKTIWYSHNLPKIRTIKKNCQRRNTQEKIREK